MAPEGGNVDKRLSSLRDIKLRNILKRPRIFSKVVDYIMPNDPGMPAASLFLPIVFFKSPKRRFF